jgi:integrase
MNIAEAAEEYMADKERRLSPETIEGYRSALRCHVLPRWGEVDVAEVTCEGVQSWVDSVPTPGAAEKAYKTLRQVVRWTLRRHQLRLWDPTQGVELPRRESPERRTLTAAQERETLRGIAGQPWEAAVLLGAALGLRRCEACGVRWEDVDWRTGDVRVRRGLHWVGGEERELPCKTRLSRRTLRLPRFALARLRQIRGSRRSGRVCSLAPHRVSSRFRRFCRAHGLPWVSMTELRHSWATISLDAGCAIEDISVALGHTTIDTARRHYLMGFGTVVRRATRAYEGAMTAS